MSKGKGKGEGEGKSDLLRVVLKYVSTLPPNVRQALTVEEDYANSVVLTLSKEGKAYFSLGYLAQGRRRRLLTYLTETLGTTVYFRWDTGNKIRLRVD